MILIYKDRKTFLNEQRSRDAAAKKELIQVEYIGKIYNYCEDIYIPPYNKKYPYCTEVWVTILESGWNLWVWLVGVVNRK